MQQHHDIDVGGDRVRLCPVALERRPAHERTVPFEHVFHPLTVVADHDDVGERAQDDAADDAARRAAVGRRADRAGAGCMVAPGGVAHIVGQGVV